MLAAARLGDPISHSNALNGFLLGAAIGAALIVAAAVTIFTGGLCAGLVVAFFAGFAPFLPGIGAAWGSKSRTPTGAITTGSRNVFINGKPAVPATLSTATCAKDPALLMVAAGSATVFINQHHAARKGDPIVCGAKIDAGSDNVFFDDSYFQEQDVADEIPPELKKLVEDFFKYAEIALAVLGLTMLVRAAMKLTLRTVAPCAMKFAASFAAGAITGYASEKAVQALTGYVGNPVDVSTGRKFLPHEGETDFVLPGRMEIACARFYASDLHYPSVLGQGWRLPWEAHLQLHADEEKISYIDAQGRAISLPPLQASQKIYVDAEQLFWGRLADGRYLIITLDQTFFVFQPFANNGVARLSRIEDSIGERLEFAYDEQQQLHTLSNRSGQSIHLHYTKFANGALRLTSIWQPEAAHALVCYAYDEQGQLCQVMNALGETTRRFAYQDGLMIWQANQLGLQCHYRWQAIAGGMRVVEHHSNTGEHFHFDYDVAARITYVQKSDGIQHSKARWQYNQAQQITACQDFDGLNYALHYDDARNIVQAELPGARSLRFEYDEFGRCTADTDMLGHTTRRAYYQHSDAVCALYLADSSHWGFVYDQRGLLTTRINPLGEQERFFYDSSGKLTKYLDAGGKSRQFDYASRGQISRSTDCSGNITRYAYDAEGHLACHTDPLGHITWFTRDRLGRIIEIKLADDTRQHYRYGEQGLISEQQDAAGRVQHWQYDLRGQVTQHVDQMQRAVRHEYDAFGHLLRLINQNQAAHHFQYDAVGRLLEEIGVDGVCRRYYYQDGELVKREKQGIASNGITPVQQSYFTYDDNGQLLRVKQECEVRDYRYDALGRVLEIKRTPSQHGSALGILPDLLQWEYDAAGRISSESGAYGTLRQEWDRQGNPQTLHLGQAQQVQWLRYGSGHVHQIRFDDGQQNQMVCDFERDSLHRETLRSLGKLELRTGYDPFGRKLWQCAIPEQQADHWQAPTMPIGSRRDPLSSNNLLPPPWSSIVQQAPLWHIWHYRANGELASQQDSLRGLTQYHYDRAGFLRHRASERKQPAGWQQHEQFCYDPAGNLERRASRSQVDNNRLVRWQEMRFEYDGFGNLSKKSQGVNQVQEFTYDSEQRLISLRKKTPSQETLLRFHYDALGRRIAKQVQTVSVQDGNSQHNSCQHTWFVWQGMRLLQEIQSPKAHSSAAFSSDSAGNTLRTYLYDPTQDYAPLAQIEQTLQAKQKASAAKIYYYHTDQIGTPSLLTDSQGNTRWAAQYSAWGKLEKQLSVEPVEQNLRFQGQYADQESGLHYNTFRYFDPEIGRFINQDPIGLLGGINLYQYAPNATGWVDPWGWVRINVGNEGAVTVNAYPGPNAGGIEHAPLHAHLNEGKLEVRVLMEDYYKKGKLVASAGDVYPGEPDLTKGMKKAIKSNLSLYQEKTKKIFNSGSC